MQSDFTFKHELHALDGLQEITEHYVNGVEADGLGRILVRFGEFLHAAGFDVTVSLSSNTVTFDWNWDNGEELDTNVEAPEEYCDDTHGLDVNPAPTPEQIATETRIRQRYEEAKAAEAAKASQAHPTIFGVGQLVTVIDDPKGPDAGWVEGLSGPIIETRQDNSCGTIHLVKFPGFRKPKHFIGDRDTWWVIAADLQPV